jgi:uncharacterized protein YegL
MTTIAPTQVLTPQAANPGPAPQASEAAGQKIFPVFLVIDTSWSMEGARLDAAQSMAPALLDVCLEDPTIRDKVRVELITFNATAEVVVPSSRASDVRTIPTLAAAGGTNYSAAFTLLRQRVEEVGHELRADGFKVLRPVVFFISDGEPTDRDHDRDRAFAELTDQGFAFRPNVCMFGVGEAQRELIAAYRSGRGVAVHIPGDAAKALASIIPVITQSVLASVGPHAQGGLVIDTGALDDLDDVYVYD